MAKINKGRFTADVDGEIVVFLIGVRLNKPLKVTKWFPLFVAMPRMIRWLEKNPQAGFLGASQSFMHGGPTLVQFWRSFEDLNAFARNAEAPHLEPWRWFNRAVKDSGDVGIWHETYVVPAGGSESFYGNMPVVGLASVTAHVPANAKGRYAARRMGAKQAGDPVRVPDYD